MFTETLGLILDRAVSGGVCSEIERREKGVLKVRSTHFYFYALWNTKCSQWYGNWNYILPWQESWEAEKRNAAKIVYQTKSMGCSARKPQNGGMRFGWWLVVQTNFHKSFNCWPSHEELLRVAPHDMGQTWLCLIHHFLSSSLSGLGRNGRHYSSLVLKSRG